MSSTIQSWDTPRPRVSRPSSAAWVDSACWARATGWRVWTGTTAVPISIVEVSTPMRVTAVRASNSSGICGTQIEDRPASSAQRASRCMRSILVA